jgi:D,D-heptose 1,7-bisphosphate phosphatase
MRLDRARNLPARRGVSPAHTIRQCLLLADAPADWLRMVGDRPVLAWQLREFLRFGITEIVIRVRGEAAGLRRALPDIVAMLPHPLTIAVIAESNVDGLVASLHQRLLLCPGTHLFAANLAPLVAAQSGAQGLLPATMPMQGGFFAIDRSELRASDPMSGIRDLAANGQLQATISDAACHQLSSSNLDELPAPLLRPALFLDRDGVINIDHGYVGDRERFEWVEGAKEAVRLATSQGWHVFIVTNQSGVARGFYDEAQVIDLLGWVADEVRAVGGTIDDVRYCPHHPEASLTQYLAACAWRKPGPGMLLDLLRAWELRPERALMVGDQPTDMAAAQAAGMAGHLFRGGNLATFIAPLLAAFSP